MDSLLSAQYSAYIRTEKGFLNDGLSSAQDALETAKNRYGPTHPSIVPVLTDLATIERTLGRYDEAESNLKWGLAILENKLVPADPQTADALDHLAALNEDWGRWEDADFYEKRALAIREKNGTAGDPAQGLFRLGRIELRLHHPLEAQKLFQKSLELMEKDGSEPKQRIFLLNSLSKAYSAGNRQSNAESSLQKALALSQKSFPADSVEAADAVQKLADFYSSTGQKEKSKTLHETALKIYKGFVGVYYGYSVLPYLQRLAGAYQSVGEYATAKDLLEKALATSKEAFGPRHPLIAVTLLRLAQAEEALGDKKNARSRREEALLILQSRFAADYPLILEVKAQLGK